MNSNLKDVYFLFILKTCTDNKVTNDLNRLNYIRNKKMLEDLPDDIIIIIFKNLDLKSLLSLYKVSVRMQNVIILYNVVKECDLSLCSLGSIRTLQSNFFKDIGHNLSILNLRGVIDISKSSLIPILTKLKSLKTLDVSYTPISLVDFVDIYKVCPTINDITINFYFGKKCSDKVPKGTLVECQKVFRQLECVHFVGNDCNLLYSDIAIFILSSGKLKQVQYTVLEESNVMYRNIHLEDKMQLDFDCFSLYIPFVSTFGYLKNFSPFFLLDFESYEYFVINLYNRPQILTATEIFSKFFQERFDLKFHNHNSDIFVDGNVCVMLWRKQSNVFSDKFFDLLYNKIKIYFIYYYEDKWNPSTVSKYKRFCIKPKPIDNNGVPSDVQIVLKKKRIVLPDYVLNYDEEFKHKLEFDLYLTFSNHINAAITLPSSCEYLQKITYLNLNGPVKYSTNFFHILFRSCTKLITLNIEVTYMSISMVARSVPLSRTIKNLRLVGKGIDLDSVIMALSQCPSLENVHIGDETVGDQSFFDPTIMIEKCSNLYCVCIYKQGVAESKMSKQLKLINKVKVKCNKMHIFFKITKSDVDLTSVSNPYIDVFRLFHPIY